MNTFSPVTKYFKPKEVDTERGIFSLFSRVSVALCLMGAIICGLASHFGKPMTCYHGKDEPQDMADQYCWLHGTNKIPQNYDDHFGQCWGQDEDKEGNKSSNKYYIWVIPFLLVQCFLFMIPHFIWKLAEKGLIKDFKTSEANSLDLASDETKREEMADKFVRYFNNVKGQNNFYFAKFVLCELLNIAVLAYNFYVTNAFFSFRWGGYGFEVIKYYQQSIAERESAEPTTHDPMCSIFPTLVSCDWKTVGPSGGGNSVNGLCVLSQNIVNQWIFLILYFWYVLLFTLSAFYVLYRISTIALPQLRIHVLKNKINGRLWDKRGMLVNKVLRNCDTGDWFLLDQIGQNVNSVFFGEFLKSLGKSRNDELEDVTCRGSEDSLPMKSIPN